MMSLQSFGSNMADVLFGSIHTVSVLVTKPRERDSKNGLCLQRLQNSCISDGSELLKICNSSDCGNYGLLPVM